MISSLNFLAAAAWAVDVSAPAAAQGGGSSAGLMSFLPIIAIFAIMYFLMIRPQQKKQKEHQAMLSAVQKGDRILTSGGIFGNVTGMDDKELTVEIAPQVRVKVSRGYVAQIIKPGGDHAVTKMK